jgi:C1A family cysteine protease
VEKDFNIRTSRKMGWIPDLPDYRDCSFKDTIDSAKLTNLPPTAIIPEEELPAVFDQGHLGSCVGNSTSTMMSYIRDVTPRSRLQIYYEARRIVGQENVDEGCYIRDAIKVISTIGAGRETWWPYIESNVFVDPPLKVDRDALWRKVFSYARLETCDDFRKCLADGFPFVIGFTVYDQFQSGSTGKTGILNWPKSGERVHGGHAVCVIGYDTQFKTSQWAQDARNMGVAEIDIPEAVYIVRNSWGKDWGRNGNFAVDALYFENPNLANDAWTIRNAENDS